LRPEPSLRQYAVDDRDTISARLIELQAERDAVNAAVDDAET
jgi:hypothetical protein